MSARRSSQVAGGAVIPALANWALLYQKPTMPRSNGMPYCLPSTWYMPDGAGIDLARPRRHVGRDVLDEAGLLLLAQPAAAPRLEQVRRGARLEEGRQLGLERLVLEDRQVDLDVRMGGRVLVGQLLPQALARVVVLDVIPVDRDGGGRRRCRSGGRRCRGRPVRPTRASDGALEAPPLEQAANTTAAVANRIAAPRRDIIGLASLCLRR